jgi:hypothetical protein
MACRACASREGRPGRPATQAYPSQASSPGLASPVSSSSSIAYLSPGPSPARGGENSAHTKALILSILEDEGSRADSWCHHHSPRFVLIMLARPLLARHDRRSCPMCHTDRPRGNGRIPTTATRRASRGIGARSPCGSGRSVGLARGGARSTRAALCSAGDNRTIPITAV